MLPSLKTLSHCQSGGLQNEQCFLAVYHGCQPLKTGCLGCTGSLRVLFCAVQCSGAPHQHHKACLGPGAQAAHPRGEAHTLRQVSGSSSIKSGSMLLVASRAFMKTCIAVYDRQILCTPVATLLHEMATAFTSPQRVLSSCRASYATSEPTSQIGRPLTTCRSNLMRYGRSTASSVRGLFAGTR